MDEAMLARVVRQHAETSRLFGVSFVPVYASAQTAPVGVNQAKVSEVVPGPALASVRSTPTVHAADPVSFAPEATRTFASIDIKPSTRNKPDVQAALDKLRRGTSRIAPQALRHRVQQHRVRRGRSAGEADVRRRSARRGRGQDRAAVRGPGRSTAEQDDHRHGIAAGAGVHRQRAQDASAGQRDTHQRRDPALRRTCFSRSRSSGPRRSSRSGCPPPRRCWTPWIPCPGSAAGGQPSIRRSWMPRFRSCPRTTPHSCCARTQMRIVPRCGRI